MGLHQWINMWHLSMGKVEECEFESCCKRWSVSRKIEVEIYCWLWGHYIPLWQYYSLYEGGFGAKEIHGRLVHVCCQRLCAYFCCWESVVEAHGLVSKTPNCVSKLETNNSTCHSWIGCQNHKKNCDASFKILYHNKNFFWFVDVHI